jgi:hypothetical protein
MGAADQPHQPDRRAVDPHHPKPLRDQDQRLSTIASPLFRFTQVEFPWALGPPDGRYLLRDEGLAADSQPTHVVVIATLGAAERRRLARRRRRAEPEPDPVPVTTGRATVVEAAHPFASPEEAGAWLSAAGEDDLEGGIAVLGRVIHSFRLVTADPHIAPLGRHQALVARIGYGPGEQVADGQWTDAVELAPPQGRRSRAKVLTPQARLAAVLGGREQRLACEELILRARLDLDERRIREAALQLLVALDAAIAEISVDPVAERLGPRLEELRELRAAIGEAAQQALGGRLDADARDVVAHGINRVESILRARAVLNE